MNSLTNWLTEKQTNSMDQCPPSEAERVTEFIKLSLHTVEPKSHYHVHNSLLFNLDLSQYSCNMHVFYGETLVPLPLAIIYVQFVDMIEVPLSG
jgi:hypothetical protein